MFFYHILFIHLSADRPLGYFHILALVYNASVNMGAQIFVLVYSFNHFGYMPEVELQDHIVILCLIF